jgi:hypothetical protein
VLVEVVAIRVARRLLKDGVFGTSGAGVILRAGGPSAYAIIRPESRVDCRPGQGRGAPNRRTMLQA